MTKIGILLSGALMASTSNAQLVPEGVHRIDTGPVTMCGLTGRDALDLIARVRASSAFRRESIQSDRFEMYVPIEGMDQLVFMRPSEPAHPAVTCRHVFQDSTGNWMHQRSMRCDASRDACDRLFLEFQALDEQMGRGLRDEH